MMSDRYTPFLDHVVAETLAGRIQSEGQLERLLAEQIEVGTGELFERSLAAQLQEWQRVVDTETDELKQAKATRKLRSLKKLNSAWVTWQKRQLADNACAIALQRLQKAEVADRLTVFVELLDPNQRHPLTHPQLQQLAQQLQSSAGENVELQLIAKGLSNGLGAMQQVEGAIVSWLYDAQRSVGFGDNQQRPGPWKTWADQVTSPFPKALFQGQAQNQSAAIALQAHPEFNLSNWVELAILLRGLQTGLVAWLDKQPYSIQGGQHLAGVTFLVFAMVWSEVSAGLQQAAQLTAEERQRFAHASFQSALQVLRQFAQRENFPLYGGIFASFSGESFRETIAYLDQPLRETENTQEKARILTVLAYSQRLLGRYERALTWHQEALELAREAGDQRCEIANLNHFSRLSLYRKQYEQAIAQAQFALILARQIGDRQGEANALASLGYSQVMDARQQISAESADRLESALQALERGKKLTDAEDRQNLALCVIGIGIANALLNRPEPAQKALEQGIGLAAQVGDRDLQGLSCVYLAEACYQLQHTDLALYYACLGMYSLQQRDNPLWEKSAALLLILKGQLGAENFGLRLDQLRPKLLPHLGVDGFDYLPVLLARYSED